MPPAVVISGSENGRGSTAHPLWPVMRICRKDPRMPMTVPKSPTNGITAPSVPSTQSGARRAWITSRRARSTAASTRSCRFARSKAARYSATVGTCERSDSCRAMAASPRSRARTICSCNSRALAAKPRRNRARSMPMITAAIDPARMISFVTTITGPPLFSISSSSSMGPVYHADCRTPSDRRGRAAPMPSWTELALECARVARKGLRLPEGESGIAVILGSGLGAFADSLDDPRGLPFSELPGFPLATVPGHRGRLVYGKIAHVPVLALQGRVHGYEGHDAATVAFPARALGVLGARALVITNAAGSCNPSFAPGALMRITDHINFTGRNPLAGPNEERLGPRFPDLTHAHDARLASAP